HPAIRRPPARASGGVFHSPQVSSPVTFPRHMPYPGSTPAATLYLVDGYALIYRAFFALIARPRTTRRGENTSAARGRTNFLRRPGGRRRALGGPDERQRAPGRAPGAGGGLPGAGGRQLGQRAGREGRGGEDGARATQDVRRPRCDPRQRGADFRQAGTGGGAA